MKPPSVTAERNRRKKIDAADPPLIQSRSYKMPYFSIRDDAAPDAKHPYVVSLGEINGVKVDVMTACRNLSKDSHEAFRQKTAALITLSQTQKRLREKLEKRRTAGEASK